jgi:hypothetical protein
MVPSGRAIARITACACLVASVAAGAADAAWCEAEAAGACGLARVDTGSDWFQVYDVAPGVFAISEPRQYEGVTSFLVVGSERALLFDTGLGVARIGEVVRGLTDRPVTVLNSHTHFDHVGGNSEFAPAARAEIGPGRNPGGKGASGAHAGRPAAVPVRGVLGPHERVDSHRVAFLCRTGGGWKPAVR